MGNKPKSSLCVLTYNRAKLLPRSLDGLLRQTNGDFEIVINDDCSSDDTTEVAMAYAKKDSRVRYFRNAKNLRYAGNQNAAMERARADYVAFIHDGDIYREDMVEKWTAALDRFPTAAFVFNSHGVLDQAGRPARVISHPFPDLIPGLCFFDSCILQPSLPVWGILLVRKSCLKRVGIFAEEFPVLADVDMWLRLMLHDDCAYIREPLVYVAPREKGHQNARVNWRISTEIERIYWRNLKRRVALGGLDREFMEAGVDAMLKSRWLLQLAICLKHGRLIDVIHGLRHLASFKSRRRFEYGG